MKNFQELINLLLNDYKFREAMLQYFIEIGVKGYIKDKGYSTLYEKIHKKIRELKKDRDIYSISADVWINEIFQSKYFSVQNKYLKSRKIDLLQDPSLTIVQNIVLLFSFINGLNQNIDDVIDLSSNKADLKNVEKLTDKHNAEIKSMEKELTEKYNAEISQYKQTIKSLKSELNSINQELQAIKDKENQRNAQLKSMLKSNRSIEQNVSNIKSKINQSEQNGINKDISENKSDKENNIIGPKPPLNSLEKEHRLQNDCGEYNITDADLLKEIEIVNNANLNNDTILSDSISNVGISCVLGSDYAEAADNMPKFFYISQSKNTMYYNVYPTKDGIENYDYIMSLFSIKQDDKTINTSNYKIAKPALLFKRAMGYEILERGLIVRRL